MISPKVRRAATELEDAISEGAARRVLDLVDEWGLSAGDRIAVVRELDRRAHNVPSELFALSFDRFDRARTVADVWRT